MAVKDTLNKIVERHQDVIGAMVLADGKVQHNLEAPYDVLNIEYVLETLTEMFENTEMLADDGYDFGEVMVDFSNHSLIVRTIEDGVLAVLAPQLQRGQLVKLHVGLGIFAKAVQKAISEEAAAPSEAPAPETKEASEPDPAPAPVPLNATAVDVDQQDYDSAEAPDESSFGMGFKRKSRGFRGTREMLAARFQQTPDAATEAQPKEEAAEGEANEEGVPLNADGTPKKKKMYRGQVYYE